MYTECRHCSRRPRVYGELKFCKFNSLLPERKVVYANWKKTTLSFALLTLTYSRLCMTLRLLFSSTGPDRGSKAPAVAETKLVDYSGNVAGLVNSVDMRQWC